MKKNCYQLCLLVLISLITFGCGRSPSLDQQGDPSEAVKRSLSDVVPYDSLWPTCTTSWDARYQWSCLGPFNSEHSRMMHQGRIDAISVHPQRPSEMLAGAYNGGVWRTVDGGQTWTNTTDDEGFSIAGAYRIERHPADPNIVYVATNTGISLWNGPPRNRGIGVLVSFDAGVTWRRTGHRTDFGAWMSASEALAIDPRSTPERTILYVANARRVLRYVGPADAMGKWTSVYHDKRSFNGPGIFGPVGIHDIEANRHGDVFMANFTGLFKMSNGQDTFEQLEVKEPEAVYRPAIHKGKTYNEPIKRVYDIEITASDHLCILAVYYHYTATATKSRMVYKPYYYSYSHDWGETWTAPQATPTAGHVVPQLAVHEDNPEHIYFESSSRQVVRSTNGGRGMTRLKRGRVHVDVRCMELLRSGASPDGSDDILLLGNDGGVAQLDSTRWIDLTGDGMVLTNYFGLDLYPTDTPMILLGAQDGSINYLLGSEWYPTSPGGDNGDCLFIRDQVNRAYQESNGTLYVGNFAGPKYRGRSRGRLYNRAQLFPLAANPLNPGEVFVGGRVLLRTADEGQTYDTLQYHDVTKVIFDIDMSPADTNLVYFVVDGFYWNDRKPATHMSNVGGIYRGRRMPSGQWTVDDITANLKTKCKDGVCGLKTALTSVTVDPQDANRIWVAMSGKEKDSKVYRTEDGGQSWTNVTTCLPNVDMTSLLYVPGSDDGIMVGTEYGVYYRSAEMQEWVRYGIGGPQCMIPDMVYHPIEQSVYVATMGRGLWRVSTK